MSRKRICIIAFKRVRTSIHVLRQIDYFAGQFDLTVIGYGEPDPSWPPLAWRSVPEPSRTSKVSKLLWYAPGRVCSSLYDAWFWSAKRHKLAYQYAVASGAHAFHANDWPSLPIAVKAARRTGGRVIFHMHEYAEEERTDSLLWRVLVSPAIRFLIRKYVSQESVQIDVSITVCEPIAKRYQQELGLHPMVVFNAPKPIRIPEREDDRSPERIRLIHHGFAKRGRGLHKLVQALAETDQRFVLDFMLMEDDRGYINELKMLADRIAPGRVHFRAPVPPGEIVRCVSEYDIGFCVIEPSTYNNLMMLPNKLFEYIQAGLALCVGPSPAMVDLVQRYGVGVAATSFEPKAVAATLNRLSWEEIGAMKRAARCAATVLNADVEMGKVVTMYRRLLDGEEKEMVTVS